MKTPLFACALVAFGFSSPALLAAAAPVSGETPAGKGLVFATQIAGSGDGEMKGGGSTYRHLSFVHADMTVSQTLPVGPAGSLTFGLAYSVSAREIAEPVGWKDDDFWKEYKRNHPNWDRIPIPERLHSLSASLELAQQLNDRWSFSASVSQGSHVAQSGLLSEGWGTCASAMGLYAWSPKLTLAVGLAYDSLSHDYRLVPVLGVDWRVSEKWNVAIGFPSTAVGYRLNSRVAFALEVSGSGGTYYVKDDPAPGIAPRSLAGSELETTEVRLGFKVDWKINDTFSISSTLGHVLYREYKYIDRGFRLKSSDAPAFGAISGSIAL